MDQIIRAHVIYQGTRAGELSKLGREGYRFKYLDEYLMNSQSVPIARAFPLQSAPFQAPRLFPFFEGLLTEGFLRRIQSMTQKVDERDSFQLLLNNGEDLIGAVSVVRAEESS